LSKQYALTWHRDSIAERDRKKLKSTNKKGDPIKLDSKILAVVADPNNEGIVFVAEAAGRVTRIDLNVSVQLSSCLQATFLCTTPRIEKEYRK
jgi:hypothetical protein